MAKIPNSARRKFQIALFAALKPAEIRHSSKLAHLMQTLVHPAERPPGWRH
jgi:hypothetical protein